MAQVRDSMRDAGPMVPAGLRHWTLWGTLPHALLGAFFQGHSTYLWCIIHSGLVVSLNIFHNIPQNPARMTCIRTRRDYVDTLGFFHSSTGHQPIQDQCAETDGFFYTIISVQAASFLAGSHAKCQHQLFLASKRKNIQRWKVKQWL